MEWFSFSVFHRWPARFSPCVHPASLSRTFCYLEQLILKSDAHAKDGNEAFRCLSILSWSQTQGHLLERDSGRSWFLLWDQKSCAVSGLVTKCLIGSGLGLCVFLLHCMIPSFDVNIRSSKCVFPSRRFADFVEAHVCGSRGFSFNFANLQIFFKLSEVPTKSKQSKHLISHDANSKTSPWLSAVKKSDFLSSLIGGLKFQDSHHQFVNWAPTPSSTRLCASYVLFVSMMREAQLHEKTRGVFD